MHKLLSLSLWQHKFQWFKSRSLHSTYDSIQANFTFYFKENTFKYCQFTLAECVDFLIHTLLLFKKSFQFSNAEFYFLFQTNSQVHQTFLISYFKIGIIFFSSLPLYILKCSEQNCNFFSRKYLRWIICNCPVFLRLHPFIGK